MKRAYCAFLVLVFLTLMAKDGVGQIMEDSCTSEIQKSTPSSDFVQIGAGETVLHKTTNLEWARCAHGQRWIKGTCEGEPALVLFSEALAIPANLADLGWRIPNVKELASIVEYCRSRPSINREIFPNSFTLGGFAENHFWTSSARAATQILGVQFFSGTVVQHFYRSPSRVRLVRDGPPLIPVETLGKLNDTGIEWCANGNTNNLDCPVAGFPGQDGEFGRDALAREGQLDKVGGGAGGFDFTKLDANGNDLSENASDWSCVRDNHTGLVWEVKTDDGGLSDKDNTYTWYNPDPNTNGGDSGSQDGGNCVGSSCDTNSFVNSLNRVAICGIDQWMLPSRRELESIVDFGVDVILDSDYFPNNVADSYWTSTPSAEERSNDRGIVFTVDFGRSFTIGSTRNSDKSVRLVSKNNLLVTKTTGLPEDSCTNEAISRSTPSSEFSLLEGGSIVRHNATGLEWQRCAFGQQWDGSTCTGFARKLSWENAFTEATLVGGNWRIPNIKEMASISEDCRNDPAINQVVFPRIPNRPCAGCPPPSPTFWSSSSSTISGFGRSAWIVSYYDGSTSPAGDKFDIRMVRLVRTQRSADSPHSWELAVRSNVP